MSLTGHHMPPRTTQQSHRPRVSDRTMVGTLPPRCLQALPHGTKNAATDGPGYRATPRSTTEPHRGWMSDVRHLPSPSPCGRGEVFSLDIPFYRTPPARSYSVMPFQNCEGPVGILSDDRVACLITHCGYIAYSSFLVEP